MERVKEWISIVLGNGLVAASVSFFVLPNSILNGGTSGLAIALEPLIHVDEVIIINTLTIGLYLLGVIFLGKKFAIGSLASTIVYPIWLTLFTSVSKMYPANTFVMPSYLAAIYSGVLSGIGLGLVFRVNASTGGMDVPALLLHKYVHMKTADAVVIVDVLTVLVGIYSIGLVPALIGIVSVYVTGKAIDRTVTLGAQKAKNVMIISEAWQDIRQALFDGVDRGVTLLDAQGGYTRVNRPVLMCVIQAKQYPKLETIVNQIDSKAFIIVNDVQQVRGSGFTFEDE